jgi:hypothetical protein
MTKRPKKNSKQLPLLCTKCEVGGPIEVTQESDRVMIRCLNCDTVSVALTITPLTPVDASDEVALNDIEIALLARVSKPSADVYQYVRRFQAENKYAPTMRDIQLALGYASPSNAGHHLKQLEAAGLLERDYGAARAIRLLHAA